VRELENAIERACVLCEDDLILPGDLPPPHRERGGKAGRRSRQWRQCQLDKVSTNLFSSRKRGIIEATLAHCGGSREKAASMLGISMATLYRKIEPRTKSEAALDDASSSRSW